jgi:hypothetical protein
VSRQNQSGALKERLFIPVALSPDPIRHPRARIRSGQAGYHQNWSDAVKSGEGAFERQPPVPADERSGGYAGASAITAKLRQSSSASALR